MSLVLFAGIVLGSLVVSLVVVRVFIMPLMKLPSDQFDTTSETGGKHE